MVWTRGPRSGVWEGGTPLSGLLGSDVHEAALPGLRPLHLEGRIVLRGPGDAISNSALTDPVKLGELLNAHHEGRELE